MKFLMFLLFVKGKFVCKREYNVIVLVILEVLMFIGNVFIVILFLNYKVFN